MTALGSAPPQPARLGAALAVVLTFAALAALPWLLGSFAVDLVTKTMIYAILALSLELLVGRTGLVCFGQAAFFGIGAYAGVLLAPESEPGRFLLLALAAVVSAAAYALLVGALSLRTRGVYFIMVTLAFAQMAYYIVHDTPLGGGTDGIYLTMKPQLLGLDLDAPRTMYFVVWTALLLVFAGLAMLGRARFGHALAGIRDNEQRMRAAGFPTFPYKLAAFTLSGGIAGLAGLLFAVKDGVVNPELMSWHLSGAVLIMVLLGGLGHLRGALIGAFAFALLQELYKSHDLLGRVADRWQLLLGLTIIAFVATMPHGLIGLPQQWREARARRQRALDPQADEPGAAS